MTRQQFDENLVAKVGDSPFNSDMGALLASGHEWNLEKAAANVRGTLLALLDEA